MCIIVTKPRGVEAPKWEYIKQSCDRNPDGFAVSWHKEGMAEPEVKRTLNKEEFLEYFKSIAEDKDTAWMLHARIKSAGSIKLENCHCWRDVSTGLVFCHNGTLSIKASGDMTDSETFFRHLYVPALLGGSDGNSVVEAVIGASKFAFMNKKGDIITYGNYVSDESCPGVQFSNATYKPFQATKKYSTYSGYNNYSQYSDYDYPDEDYYRGSYYQEGTTPRKTTTHTSSTTSSNMLMASHGWAFFRPNKK